jgi:hypothetical protein
VSKNCLGKRAHLEEGPAISNMALAETTVCAIFSQATAWTALDVDLATTTLDQFQMLLAAKRPAFEKRLAKGDLDYALAFVSCQDDDLTDADRAVFHKWQGAAKLGKVWATLITKRRDEPEADKKVNLFVDMTPLDGTAAPDCEYCRTYLHW